MTSRPVLSLVWAVAFSVFFLNFVVFSVRLAAHFNVVLYPPQIVSTGLVSLIFALAYWNSFARDRSARRKLLG